MALDMLLRSHAIVGNAATGIETDTFNSAPDTSDSESRESEENLEWSKLLRWRVRKGVRLRPHVPGRFTLSAPLVTNDNGTGISHRRRSPTASQSDPRMWQTSSIKAPSISAGT